MKKARRIGIWCRKAATAFRKSYFLNWMLAKLFHFPPIMGQQTLCQNTSPAFKKANFIYIINKLKRYWEAQPKRFRIKIRVDNYAIMGYKCCKTVKI